MIEGEEEKHAPVHMTAEHIKSGLSQVGKTFDGSSVSFIKLDIENKNLDIPSPLLSNFKHLRYVNLANNHFNHVDILSDLPFLIKLDLRDNRLSSLSIFDNPNTFQYLKYLDLTGNEIEAFTGIAVPKLETLKLRKNKIGKIANFSGHAGLKFLELSGNKLVSLENLQNLTGLEELWLEENAIGALAGIQNVPNLKKVYLRKNALNGFNKNTLPDIPNLSYLNFSENEVVEVSEIGNLNIYSNLNVIVVTDNPLKAEPTGDVKKEVLIVLPQLKFVGDEEVTPEEREDAISEGAERRRVAEEARIEAERVAKEAMYKEEGDKVIASEEED